MHSRVACAFSGEVCGVARGNIDSDPRVDAAALAFDQIDEPRGVFAGHVRLTHRALALLLVSQPDHLTGGQARRSST